MADMWGANIGAFEIIIAALMINLRYFLVGISLNPLFVNSSYKQKFKYMHLVADENWAVTMNKIKNHDITPLFLFGGGVCILLVWSAGTISGYLLGSFISEPSKYGLDFAFIAIFTALVINMYKSKNDLLPWLIAGIAAIICETLFAGKFYIIVGALFGSITAVILSKEKNDK